MKKTWTLAASVLHLRAPFMALTPLLPLLQYYFSLSHAAVAMLTTLPLLVFAAVSPLVGGQLPRFGAARVFGTAMLCIGIGAGLRSYADIPGLFLGTVLISVGIAVGNVLLPTLIRAWYPERAGAATGIGIVLMNGMNALVIAFIVPLTNYFGWQAVCAVWALTALPVAIAWFTLPRERETPHAGAAKLTIRKLLAHPAARWIAVFMGVQSLVYFSFMTWLPYWAMARGFSEEAAGYYTFAIHLISLPASLLAPLAAGGPGRQRLVLGVCATYLAGLALLLLTDTALLWHIGVVVIALAAGSTFALCMLAFSVRPATPLIASRLSGAGQAFSYLLAAGGPVGFGFLYEYSRSWPATFPVFALATLLLAYSGWQALDFPRIGEEETTVRPGLQRK